MELIKLDSSEAISTPSQLTLKPVEKSAISDSVESAESADEQRHTRGHRCCWARQTDANNAKFKISRTIPILSLILLKHYLSNLDDCIGCFSHFLK